ncbi:MAG TPA: ATP-dependent DNA helicase RecG, partial [Desulfobacterales bacterium]|nr:ATP-dependent DNA helicase RecG [Desulfobacterales bacterium]
MKQQALALLRRALAQPGVAFRKGQWEAISALVLGRSQLLVVQRTGWGKSLVYFLATRLLRDHGKGPTLLVSPLLALMRNQVEMAERLGVRAATINSANRKEWQEIKTRLLKNKVDILLVSPERLANDEFREQVLMPLAGTVGLFVVDEAHCISDWGHDFRPDYRRITRILQALPPNIPMLATTATANDRVVNDIQSQLGPRLTLLRGPLGRASLRLQNIHLPGQAARMAWLSEHLPSLPGSGIIYTLTIRDAQRLATWLQSEGIQAFAYWGGLDNDSRVDLEQRLLDNRIKALVATSALGMGFDKPDLGFVIHFQRPGSVIHYYQQVGRAGRALDEAYGIMLSGAEDEEITNYFIRTAFPPEGHTREVLAALNRAEDGLSLSKLEGDLNLRRGQIEKVL